MTDGIERRAFIVGLGIAATGIAAAVPDPVKSLDSSLNEAFQDWVKALNGGDITHFLAMHHADALFIDEDVPFRMDKGEFIDHLGFHDAKIWESFSWVPRTAEMRLFHTTGIVAGLATFRGKPRDAGFRLRHLLYMLGWTYEQRSWRVVSLHLSPVLGHVIASSPS